MIKVALIGAGSVVFSKNLTGDILSYPEFKNATFSYMDIDKDRLEVGANLCRKVAKALGADPKIEATQDRRKALKGADFVINMVQIGGFDSTLVDFEIPRKYGLNFTIADTTGPGGLFRALRTFPMLSSMCQDMMELCPKAVLLNYSNPMSMNMQTITRTSNIAAVGLCHSVQGTFDELMRYIGEKPQEVAFICAGINHMAFYQKIEKDGVDLYPRLFEASEKPEIFRKNAVRFELMRRLGYYVTESSEHNAEYNPYFIPRGKEMIEKFDVPIDEYLRRCDGIVDEFERMRIFSKSDEPMNVKKSHEYGSTIIHSIVTGKPSVVYGNMPNRGAISNLPDTAIAEVPTLVDRSGLALTTVGELPPQLIAYMQPHVSQHELFIRAAMEGRRDHVYQAAMFDPLTAATLSLDQIVQMCDELIAAHGELLPPLKAPTLVPTSGREFSQVDPKVYRQSWDKVHAKTSKNNPRGRAVASAIDERSSSGIPADYAERVYAGVLGKIIGVYLGRPIENWLHKDILAKIGEVNYYVHEQGGVPLVVTDDDISGTFTFIRALEDHGNNKGITAADIGQSWLNYIIENRSILWWGGMGTSTEHTAYLRLKHGMRAPHSGSIATNGKVVAEQIGAQIFIDGWAMVAPGDPELAASLAQRAASVSHDGEAIYAAQIVAAMEALAFVKKDIGKILDAAAAFIPKDSVIFRMIDELREFQQKVPIDWKKAFAEVLETSYGYDKFGGGCHAVPNHGIIILALLYGQNDFQHSLMIANTCGWDTDCNSGNVGCFMGIKNGLAGIEAGPDWRKPVGDRLYLPTADAGSCMNDAVTQTYKIVNMGRALAGEEAVNPKDGARFHFSLPGSVQGFVADESPDCAGVISDIFNAGQSLAVVFRSLATGRAARVGTATFLTAEMAKMPGYAIIASPTIYPGQRMRASVALRSDIELTARLYWKHIGPEDQAVILRGPEFALTEEHQVVEWITPFTGGHPITEVGLELSSARSVAGVIDIDYFTWDGEPDVTLLKQGWANGANVLQEAPKTVAGQQLVLIQNEGRGLAMQGTRQWKNYRVAADVTPHMTPATGIAARVQGMQRYYALLLCNDGKVKLVKVLDGETVLSELERAIELDRTYRLELQVNGSGIRASMDSELLFEVNDFQRPLLDGGVGLVCEEGRSGFGPVTIKAG